MRKIFTRIGIAAVAACTLVSAAACGEEMYAYDSFAYFNTQTRWAFLPKGSAAGDAEAAVWGHILTVLQDVEYSVSTDIETSDISRFNAADAGETVEVGETAYNLLSIAQTVYEKTDGAYNPAVGLLVDLWGFSPRFTGIEPSGGMQPYDRPTFLAELAGRVVSELPDDEYIAAFQDLSDFSGVELKAAGGKYYVTKPQDAVAVITDGGGKEYAYTMQLNLGGIGKGYAADLGTKFIRDAGYDAGFFSVGGSSMSVFGMVENGQLTAWDVAVNNPRAGVLATGSDGEILSVRERDISLSSSGDYENCYYYQKDGRRLCHIINPNTGYPINADPGNTDGSGIICASVFGLSAAEGDATSTALLVMGKDRAIAYIQSELQGKEAVFVYYDGAEKAYLLYTNMAAENYTLYADIPVVKI